MDPILLIAIAGILVVFYFFFLLPQQKQSKKEANFLASLQLGDKIITVGGIHGVIVDIDNDRVLLQMAHGNTQLLVEKRAISTKVPPKPLVVASKKKARA